MNKSENINELAKALHAAQKEIKSAKKESENPFFKSTYADLGSVWEACREALNNNGLSISQGMTPDPTGGVIIDTFLMHVSGQWLQSSMRLVPVRTDPQSMGSCVTYGRRYELAAICNIVTEDDDGNEASVKEAFVKEKAVSSVEDGTSIISVTMKATPSGPQYFIKSRSSTYMTGNIKLAELAKNLKDNSSIVNIHYSGHEVTRIYAHPVEAGE